MNSVFKFFSTLILVFLVLMILPNIPAISQADRNINEIKAAAIMHAKYNGGFTDQTVSLISEMAAERSMDVSKLRYVFSPALNEVAQKRSTLYIRIEYDVPLQGWLKENNMSYTIREEKESISNKYTK